MPSVPAGGGTKRGSKRIAEDSAGSDSDNSRTEKGNSRKRSSSLQPIVARGANGLAEVKPEVSHVLGDKEINTDTVQESAHGGSAKDAFKSSNGSVEVKSRRVSGKARADDVQVTDAAKTEGSCLEPSIHADSPRENHEHAQQAITNASGTEGEPSAGDQDEEASMGHHLSVQVADANSSPVKPSRQPLVLEVPFATMPSLMDTCDTFSPACSCLRILAAPVHADQGIHFRPKFRLVRPANLHACVPVPVLFCDSWTVWRVCVRCF